LAHAAGASIALLAYFSAVLLHEWGHVVVARRRMCQVFAVELYPLVGLTRFERPRTRLDHCLIAWAGVVFQGVVGLPMFLWIKLVGYTPLEVVNAFMAVFSFLTVVMVPLNLVPIPPLDGAVAWGIVPLLFRRLRERSRGRPTRWNSLR
jgi:Zn-dependent protease